MITYVPIIKGSEISLKSSGIIKKKFSVFTVSGTVPVKIQQDNNITHPDQLKDLYPEESFIYYYSLIFVLISKLDSC